ncbi:RNA binding family protein [Perilla frutescens var. frutescens]|nr:RNA binding family protein [Perilla frutescens var. frutescens]
MSNEEEKRCPLCAEEMDWTDQQFMPCKCGYQVCVWCWHHIIDMAEKDEAEGRCPACRTIYEKEKIVAMQTNCERTMSKVSNRKTKPPKAKPKANEVKKDLTNVRVIQRRMAYVIGLPLSLADEDVLQRKEYFGQYGKVTKVSLSRSAGGAIQQFINDTCSVYLTFSKEEEALRCIQSVHGFVLEGRFLRASFGTAKYCHAWLKNMPCNNPACLYLHSIGADEDSFGKDEVAAVHTRSRVHQIVGAANNVIKRSGTVLPPPVDDVHISSSAFGDKSTTRSSILDSAHGSGNSTSDLLPCKDKEGPIAVPHKMTTFVDIVGRSSYAGSEKDGSDPEDRRILDLCSELSSVSVDSETHAEVPYSVSSLLKIPSSNHVANEFDSSADEPLGEGSLLYNQGSKDTGGSTHRASFLHPFYSSHFSEDSGDALLQKRTPTMNGFTVDHNPVNNQDGEVSLPIRCVNSMSNDSFQEMKFQNSAKSDQIYRNSQSFSNEEIVEHLRRIGDAGNLHDEENSGLDAVESSIISNILSIDFDSCEDSLPMPNGLSELLDEADGLGGSSWSSLNSDQSGYSFAKHDGFASQVAASILPEYGDNKEQYLCKSQYPVSRAQSLAPPGFSIPSRDPPPGFSNSDRTSCLPRPSSGGRLASASSFPSALFQPSSVRQGSSFDDADFFDPAMLPSGKGNQTNGFKNTIFEARPTSNPGLSSFEDESRFWLMMQQSASTHQEPNFSQIFAPQIPSSQQELSFAGCYKVNGMSGLDDVYGLSSRLVDEHPNCDTSFFTQMPQQKYANGHVSNTNGYLHSLDEAQHKGEAGLAELQRNERLGVKYFSGYGGDLMFSSGDVYTRVFGL